MSGKGFDDFRDTRIAATVQNPYPFVPPGRDGRTSPWKGEEENGHPHLPRFLQTSPKCQNPPRMDYITSVGMEVHAELLTKSKMFCGCPNAFGGEVNSRVCPVCAGLPGTLPVINYTAVIFVLKTALALNCNIGRRSLFHRKNYFYPDLPKGYQVSQYEETNPIGYYGHIEIPGDKTIRIKRVHLEEDTGKLLHLPDGGSGIDYNRAGVPLMEIVTDFPPDIHTPEEAKLYLQFLRLTLIYLGVCDGKMEHGSMRCEPNISIAPKGSDQLGTKTELKNLGSFKAVSLGIEHESKRMAAALANGETLRQETRGWNEALIQSYPMRVKEFESDYRYFPDPDLPPMQFTEELIETTKRELPELPMAKRKRFINEFGLSEYDADITITDPRWAAFFDDTVKNGGDPKLCCNWMNGDFARLLNEEGIPADKSKVTPKHIADLVSLVSSDKISGKMAKELFEETYETGEMPSSIVERKGLSQVSDESAIRAIVLEVLNANADSVEKYKSGKTGVLGFLVGQVMKQSGGKANPKIVNELIERELNS